MALAKEFIEWQSKTNVTTTRFEFYQNSNRKNGETIMLVLWWLDEGGETPLGLLEQSGN